MEVSRVRDGSRTLVPHRFTVRLTPDDLAAIRASAPSLAADLADGALAFARAHGYSLLDRPTVSLRADPSVEVGDIVVDIIAPGQPEAARQPSSGPARHEVAPAIAPSGPIERSTPPAEERPAAPRTGPRPGHGTAVFVVPVSDGPRATLREHSPDGSSRTIVFDGRPLTIGRAPDNGLVVRDGRASRHHARIDGRRGSLVLSDLGSTNGSFVNDRRVESVALGAGDRIRIGATSFVVEVLDDDVASDDSGAEPADVPPADVPDESGR
jgi:hypothetical protein